MINEESYKIVISGESGVGKSSIMSTFVKHNFPETFISTIGIDYNNKKIITKFNDNLYHISLKIFDTSGQKRFQNIIEYYYTSNLDGLVVVFDVTNMDSFIRAEEIIERFISYTSSSSQIPILLVGNKIDLFEKRCISSKLAQELATKYNVKQYIEISAKTDINYCEEIFRKISKLIFESRLFEVYIMNEDNIPPEEQKNIFLKSWHSLYNFLGNTIFCSRK